MQPKYLCLALIFALVLVQIQAAKHVINNKVSNDRDNDNESEEQVDEDDEHLLWHNDELPYESNAKCRRGFSYYSNSINADDTDIDVPTEIDSLLDYQHRDVCFYCVCAVSARSVRCVPRDPWFCEYYRTIRHQDAMRVDYAKEYQQDRPAYFKSLPYRIRRTMDWGLIDMIDIAQKGLGRPACIPYMSEYSDCSEYTSCKGCNQCRCNGEGQWVCYKKQNTCADGYDEMELYDDGTDENVVGTILKELVKKQKEEIPNKPPTHRAPLPEKRKRVTESPVLGLANEDVMKELKELLRGRRSTGEYNETHRPIIFHHAIDTINEDTLKNSNISGTLGIRKVDIDLSGRGSRRSGLFVNSTSHPLHIDYNKPSIYNNHIADNKIDSAHNVYQYDALVNEKLHNIVNYSQSVKDKELSKLVVNELKRGSETIGDVNAPVTSNITFTPEKDTLTAMAFITGNLLNRLWNLERDTSEGSIEVDNMKNQRIADLLELFKEPLSYRQELFLKDALEHISEAVNTNKDNKHFSLCETVDKIKDEALKGKITEAKHEEVTQKNVEESAASNALSKLIEILGLIKKYEATQTNLHDLKHPKDISRSGLQIPVQNGTKDNQSSLNLFGNILEKITDLLIPNKNNKIRNKMRNMNILRTSHNLDDDIKKAFNINLDSMKLTSADKLILDYLSKVQMNPCSSSNLQEDKSIRYKESNILLNLSEFFKIKSYSDLMNIINPVTKLHTTTQTPTTLKSYEIRRTANTNSSMETENNTPSINDKIKVHLKAIVNDLIELEKSKGKDLKSKNVNIADVLPCLFNILKQEKEEPKETKYFNANSALLNKIKTVIEAVRKDIKNIPLSRRSNKDPGPRPKSAVVWERLVSNLFGNPQSSRRFLKIVKPQSYETVKKMIEYLETNKSNAYKAVALHKDVPASEKLLFLKTLSMDTGNYANVLGKLMVLNHEKKLPENELEDLIDFVNNAIANFDLNAKVINGLNETKNRRSNVMMSTYSQAIRGSTKKNPGIITDDFKITSDETMNQMIKNRVKQYLKMKESENETQDMGYDIAQRILSNLERGSDRLARELYKILIETSRKEKSAGSMSSIKKRKERPTISEDPLINQRASEDVFLKTLESAWANILTV